MSLTESKGAVSWGMPSASILVSFPRLLREVMADVWDHMDIGGHAKQQARWEGASIEVNMLERSG